MRNKEASSSALYLNENVSRCFYSASRPNSWKLSGIARYRAMRVIFSLCVHEWVKAWFIGRRQVVGLTLIDLTLCLRWSFLSFMFTQVLSKKSTEKRNTARAGSWTYAIIKRVLCVCYWYVISAGTEHIYLVVFTEYLKIFSTVFSEASSVTMWIIFTLLLVVGFLIHKWATQHFNYFKDRGIAYGKPIVFFGTGKDLMMVKLSISEFVLKWYNDFPGEK